MFMAMFQEERVDEAKKRAASATEPPPRSAIISHVPSHIEMAEYHNAPSSIPGASEAYQGNAAHVPLPSSTNSQTSVSVVASSPYIPIQPNFDEERKVTSDARAYTPSLSSEQLVADEHADNRISYGAQLHKSTDYEGGHGDHFASDQLRMAQTSISSPSHNLTAPVAVLDLNPMHNVSPSARYLFHGIMKSLARQIAPVGAHDDTQFSDKPENVEEAWKHVLEQTELQTSEEHEVQQHTHHNDRDTNNAKAKNAGLYVEDSSVESLDDHEKRVQYVGKY